jgi:hypothetical protein
MAFLTIGAWKCIVLLSSAPLDGHALARRDVRLSHRQPVSSLRQWKPEGEHRASGAVLGPQFASIAVKYRSRDRKSQSRSLRLRCDECIEHAGQLVVGDSLSGVGYPHLDAVGSAASSDCQVVRAGRLLIASRPFITRLMMTCCRWIGSHRTGNGSGARTVRNTTPRLVTSGETILTTSRTVSFISNGQRSPTLLLFSKLRNAA